VFQTSVVHTIGSVAVKVLLLSMASLYTNVLTKSDNALTDLLDATSQFLIAIMVLGQGQAFLREYKENADPAYQSRLIATLFWMMLGVGIAFFLLLNVGLKSFILPHLTKHPLSNIAFGIMSFTLILNALQALAINFLRADKQAPLLETTNVIGTFLLCGYCIMGLLWFNWGVLTVLEARILQVLPILIVVIGQWRKHIRLVFDTDIARKSLAYGLPLVMAAAASPVLNFADRFMMREMLGDTVQGVYGICYKFGMIPGMILVAPFLQAWQPAIYEATDEATRIIVYRRMLLYFTFAACTLWLLLSVFSLEILQVAHIEKSYHYAYQIIPWVAASQVFYGLGWIVVAGLAVQARTFFMGFWTAFSALINIGLNWIWLPKFGMIGAAYATTAAFVVIFIGFAFYSHRQLKIQFPYGRFLLMLGISYLAWRIAADWRISSIGGDTHFIGWWLTAFAKGAFSMVVIGLLGFLAGLNKLFQDRNAWKQIFGKKP
jgi:O-antigen/teichoic acid export membrane protein